MGDVTFKRCKDILCHEKYIHVLCTSVILYRPARPGLEKKSKDFCGRDDFFCSSLFFRGK